jgi:hypothetical protein
MDVAQTPTSRTRNATSPPPLLVDLNARWDPPRYCWGRRVDDVARLLRDVCRRRRSELCAKAAVEAALCPPMAALCLPAPLVQSAPSSADRRRS